MEETAEAKRNKSRKSSANRMLAYFGIGLLLGVLLLGTFRFFNVKSDSVHYHANFALYVNGVRDEFKLPTYYEEVQSCGGDETNPRTRIHLHDMDPSAVHVHDAGATWSALFANLGYTLGDTVLKTSTGTYIDGQDGKKLTFLLNGEPVMDAVNRTVRSEDVLLINYGDEDAATQKQRFDAIVRNAAEKNKQNDPSSCTGSKELTWQDRLRAAVGLNNPHHE